MNRGIFTRSFPTPRFWQPNSNIPQEPPAPREASRRTPDGKSPSLRRLGRYGAPHGCQLWFGRGRRNAQVCHRAPCRRKSRPSLGMKPVDSSSWARAEPIGKNARRAGHRGQPFAAPFGGHMQMGGKNSVSTSPNDPFLTITLEGPCSSFKRIRNCHRERRQAPQDVGVKTSDILFLNGVFSGSL